MATESDNKRVWLTSLPHVISALFPSAPACLRYEYTIGSLDPALHGGLSVTLMIRTRCPNPAQRLNINPERLAQTIVANVGGGTVLFEALRRQYRVENETTGAFRIENVAFR